MTHARNDAADCALFRIEGDGRESRITNAPGRTTPGHWAAVARAFGRTGFVDGLPFAPPTPQGFADALAFEVACDPELRSWLETAFGQGYPDLVASVVDAIWLGRSFVWEAPRDRCAVDHYAGRNRSTADGRRRR